MDLAVQKAPLGHFGLGHLGVIHENLPPARLVEAAVRRREGVISATGALAAGTGKRTGRSPKDRFIVENDLTRDKVAWGAVNKPVPPEKFDRTLRQAMAYMENLDEVYVMDAYAGSDPRYGLNVHVVTEFAWHALFARPALPAPAARGPTLGGSACTVG